MPQVEALGSGVPIASVDYSAMADVVEKSKGFPLKCQKMFYEWETNAFRAYPDNAYTADQWYKFINYSDAYKKRKSKQAKDAADKWFNWDRSAQIWEKHFESVVLTGLQGKWNSPRPIRPIPDFQEMPDQSNTQYVEWLCNEVAQDPKLFSSYFGLNLIDQLNMGVTSNFKQGTPINRKNAYDMCLVLGQNKLTVEQARQNLDKLPPVDYIEFAHSFEREVCK